MTTVGGTDRGFDMPYTTVTDRDPSVVFNWTLTQPMIAASIVIDLTVPDGANFHDPSVTYSMLVEASTDGLTWEPIIIGGPEPCGMTFNAKYAPYGIQHLMLWSKAGGTQEYPVGTQLRTTMSADGLSHHETLSFYGGFVYRDTTDELQIAWSGGTQ
jgi:hypothetical protein